MDYDVEKLSVHPSVRLAGILSKRLSIAYNQSCFHRLISTVKHTILVFPYRTVWYSDGASNATRGGIKQEAQLS